MKIIINNKSKLPDLDVMMRIWSVLGAYIIEQKKLIKLNGE